MQNTFFIELFFLLLSTYMVVIESICFEDDTYFINSGFESFPSTKEKTPDLCQGL